MDNIELKKKEFAKKEITSLVFQAALVRGFPPYKANVEERRRVKFKAYLSKQLEKFSKRYPDEDYIKILNDFQQEINSSEYIDILKNEMITFGRVQKLLNLYLKYLWVFDFKKDEPPHCPIDSIILGKINWKSPSWTNPEFTEKEYRKAIEMCKGKSENISIAQWELITFKNRTDLIVEN